MVNAWERYILNPATHVAHDATHLTEECNTDQIEAKVRKPSVPPGYHMCRHCGSLVLAAGETLPAEVEDEAALVEESTASGDAEHPNPGGAGGPAVAGSPDDAGGARDGAGNGANDPADGVDGPDGAGPAEAGGPAPGGAPALETGEQLTGNLAGTPHAGSLAALHALQPADPTGNLIDWPIANSSNLRTLQYNLLGGTLLVRFANGWEYHYGRVPFDVAREVALADSPGTAFDRLIKKGSFPFERVTKAQAPA